MLSAIDMDDFIGACACYKFVVTNTIINGWQSGNKDSCDIIDKLKPEF